MKPLEQSDTIDALRLMVRGWIKKRPEEIANRIAGKVAEKVDVKSDNVTKVLIEYADGKDNPA
jgi:cytochrome oxidase assembly protein ShyY1